MVQISEHDMSYAVFASSVIDSSMRMIYVLNRIFRIIFYGLSNDYASK